MKANKKSITKEKIIQTSIELFNASASLQVTTNHIAKACNLSIGNLYYHYKNKEEIIREIYALMSAKFESFEMYSKIIQSPHPLQELKNLFEQIDELFWEYRFMMRDSAILMAMDSELKSAFNANQTKRITQIEALYHFFIDKQIFIKMSDEEIRLRAKHQWFVSAYWQIFSSSEGEVTKASMQEAREVAFKLVLEPILIKA